MQMLNHLDVMNMFHHAYKPLTKLGLFTLLLLMCILQPVENQFLDVNNSTPLSAEQPNITAKILNISNQSFEHRPQFKKSSTSLLNISVHQPNSSTQQQNSSTLKLDRSIEFGQLSTTLEPELIQPGGILQIMQSYKYIIVQYSIYRLCFLTSFCLFKMHDVIYIQFR